MRVFALLVAASLIACAPQQRPSVDISNSYVAADIAPFDVPGRGTVTGQGFLRQAGGGVVTCAGSDVFLAPGIPLTKRFFAVANEGGNPVLKQGRLSQIHPSAFRIGQCDAQGNFEFSGVAPGDWVVATTVNWTVGNRAQGDDLMGRVNISGSETVKVLLSDRDRI